LKEVILVSNQDGQGTVEYVLLLAFVGFIFVALMNTKPIKTVFSKDGAFVQAIKAEMEFQYRHGLYGRQKLNTGNNSINYNNADHQTYNDAGTNNTRFFGPVLTYPQ
jgi:Flp pilus assembly pilin Flp